MSWISELGAGDIKGNVSFTKHRFLGGGMRAGQRRMENPAGYCPALPSPYITQAVCSVSRAVFGTILTISLVFDS